MKTAVSPGVLRNLLESLEHLQYSRPYWRTADSRPPRRPISRPL